MIEVRIITGCRKTYRQQRGLPPFNGKHYLIECTNSISQSDIPSAVVTLSVDGLGRRDLNGLDPQFAEIVLATVERYGYKLKVFAGGGTNAHVLEMLKDPPLYPFVLILEDDTIVCRTIYRRVVDWVARIEPDLVFGSLYNLWGSHIVDPDCFWGGQALLLRSSRIKEFVRVAENYETLLPGKPKGWIDILFSRIAGHYMEVPIRVTIPSLVQHIGDISGWQDGRFHRAPDFAAD